MLYYFCRRKILSKQSIFIKSVSIEEIRKCLTEDIDENCDIFISKEITLSEEAMKFLCKNFPNKTFIVRENGNGPQLYDEKETKVLANNVNLIRKKFDKNVEFENGYSVEKAIEASRKINDWVKAIEEKKDGKEELSTFEKYLCAYKFVTEFQYRTGDSHECRDLISVLTGDKIVCVGYARMLKEVCDRLGIPCSLQRVQWKDKNGEYHYHMNNVVLLRDDKYGIDGIYYADPTWDSYDPKITRDSTVIFSNLKFSDIRKIYKNFELSSDSEIYSSLYHEEISDADEFLIDNLNDIKNDSKKILREKKDEFLSKFRDVILNCLDQEQTLSDEADNLNEQIDVNYEMGILCSSVLRDFAIQGNLREKTLKNIKNVITTLHNNYNNFSKQEICDVLTKKVKEIDWDESIIIKYMSSNKSILKKTGKVLKLYNSKNESISKRYILMKDNASVITEQILVEALYNIGIFFGLSKRNSRQYAHNVFDSSVQKASCKSNLREKDVESPIIKKANMVM